jgi:hypothetical protein
MGELGTGNEAEIAMKKAREFMQTYGISQDKVNLNDVFIPVPKRRIKWLIILAELCSEFSGVCCFLSYKKIIFTGDEMGVNIAGELFDYLKNEIKRQLKKKKIKVQKFKNDYCYGCVVSLSERMREIGGWCDMQARRERLMEKYFSENKILKSRKSSVDRNSYYSGIESGSKINLSRQAGVSVNAGYLERVQG